MSTLIMSDSDRAWVADPWVDDEGASRLVVEMLKQAVEEYKTLCAAGIIENGAIPASAQRGRSELRKKVVGYKFAPQVRQLISFFHGQIDRWLELAHIPIDPTAVRDRLRVFDETCVMQRAQPSQSNPQP